MSDSRLVLGSFGFLVVTATLLALAGFSDVSFSTPTQPGQEEGAASQNVVVTAVECVFSFFQDCSSKTETRAFSVISDLTTFALAGVDFLFQLLTFQVPLIPLWLNAIIVIPPASTLAFIGIKTIRGTGG